MKRTLSFLILTILSTTLLINCGGGKDNASGQGVLLTPKVSKTITSTQTVQQNQSQKEANTIELPLTGWADFTYRNLTINAGHVTGAGTTKVQFCMLEGDGEDLGSVIGSGVEILDEATCMYTNINGAEGNNRYMVGITQVRIPCHAAESCIFMDKWVLTPAVKRVDTNYRPTVDHVKAGNKREE